MANDIDQLPTDGVEVAADPAEAPKDPSELALVLKIQETVRADKKFHKKAFEQMRRDMFIARNGRNPEYPDAHYKANLAGRHVKQKTAALYAKNPKAVARRRETLDFAVWDEKPKSLMMAFQTIQQAQALLASAPPMIDPVTGQQTAPEPPPEMAQAFETAMATVQDFQNGMARRTEITKIGRTLEVLFAQALREQKPVDFKTGMKQMVRRTCTTGVGYVELGFQRETGPRPGLTEQLADVRSRLDHMQRLTTEIQDGDIEEDAAEVAELQASMASLQAEPDIVVREGLIIDFPQSTRVIPDKLCRQLIGFVGARHITVEYLFTVDQVKELFKIDLGKNFAGYTVAGKSPDDNSTDKASDGTEELRAAGRGNGMVCVWKHYDKTAGLVYFVADGHADFLRPPAAPDVFVEDFWPVYALTFNSVESEDELFPPSDVFLMLDQQMEYNRSRQGMREHRKAARPRWAYANGTLQKDDIDKLKAQEPFEAIGLNLPPGQSLQDILQAVPVPGVDPNLYETGQIFTDIQMVVGSSEAQFGGTAQATATESAIAAGSSKSADDASVDDLDGFLTVVARASSQILLREMSEEQVKVVAGPGAVWPQLTLGEIAAELFLEVEAGSSGKPNQAIATQNFKELAPILIQTPGVSPEWLAKEAIKRLDDKADLTEAMTSDIPAIVAQNRMQQPAPGDPGADPAAQGGQGADNGPPPPPEQQQGSEPAFGSNQV